MVQNSDKFAYQIRPKSPNLPPGYLATRRAPVVLLCFVAFILCNLDRVNMSIAVIPLAAQHGWTSTQMGLVQSSFFWGYLATQILGGLAADKYGGERCVHADLCRGGTFLIERQKKKCLLSRSEGKTVHGILKKRFSSSQEPKIYI